MTVRFFFGQLPLVDQSLHEGVVAGAADHLGAPKEVDPGIASVHDVAFACRADQEGRHRAVRLFLGCDRRQLDHQMRFKHQLLQSFGRVVPAGRVALEKLLRCQDDLICCLSTAALASHAVSQHAECASRHACVGNDFDLILLVGAVAPVYSGGCGQPVPLRG